MIDFHSMVAAELSGMEYDSTAFAEEYDQRILSVSSNVRNGEDVLLNTIDTNIKWNMVDPNKYIKADVRSKTGAPIDNGYPSWKGVSLVYLESDDSELAENSKNGSVSIRNYVLDKHGEFKFFPQYEDLMITRYIKSLPLDTIIGVRCVSLRADTFAIIHRDNSNFLPSSLRNLAVQRMVDNFLWKQGFVQITINISDGGVPMYYSISSNLSAEYNTVNYPVYLFNDFFYHGVPITTGRRRQIRITGRPTAALSAHINQLSIVNCS